MMNDVKDENLEQKIKSKIYLENKFYSGVSWFLWIAILSVINSILVQNHSDFFLIFGLGVSAFFDFLGASAREQGTGNSNIIEQLLVSGTLSYLPSLIFFGFYYYCKKMNKVAFILGMILYLFDSLIFIYIKDYLSFGFHFFALFSMFSGLAALNKIIKLDLGIITSIDPEKDEFNLDKRPTQYSLKQSIKIVVSIFIGIILIFGILQYFVDG